MVSLWPWRGDNTSPASFEKALSALSGKISQSQLLLDNLRQRSRRFKALWTLYTSFAYMLCAIILGLVVGWKNCGRREYGILAGSPLIIYLGRTGLDTYYTYRINSVAYRLAEQQTEQAKTIDKLKAATKYNSTQQLLEKYGGESPKPSPKPKTSRSPARTLKGPQKATGRTGIGPPATANIPQNRQPPQPSTPQPVQLQLRSPLSVTNSPVPGPRPGPPEFAPNAFSTSPQYETSDLTSDGNWYDRILDLILGDDETSPKNRVVLICKHCRLVNGQAPPGVKRLEDIGKWQCGGCRGWNGDQDEGTKIVEEMMEKMSQELPETSNLDKGEDTVKAAEEVDVKTEDEDEEFVVGRSGVKEDETSKKPRRGRSKKGGAS